MQTLYQVDSIPNVFIAKNKKALWPFYFLEQMTGIEPASSAWEAEVLPLNYICIILLIYYNKSCAIFQVFFYRIWQRFYGAATYMKKRGYAFPVAVHTRALIDILLYWSVKHKKNTPDGFLSAIINDERKTL